MVHRSDEKIPGLFVWACAEFLNLIIPIDSLQPEMNLKPTLNLRRKPAYWLLVLMQIIYSSFLFSRNHLAFLKNNQHINLLTGFACTHRDIEKILLIRWRNENEIADHLILPLQTK